jgi:hypothetical protein
MGATFVRESVCSLQLAAQGGSRSLAALVHAIPRAVMRVPVKTTGRSFGAGTPLLPNGRPTDRHPSLHINRDIEITRLCSLLEAGCELALARRRDRAQTGAAQLAPPRPDRSRHRQPPWTSGRRAHRPAVARHPRHCFKKIGSKDDVSEVRRNAHTHSWARSSEGVFRTRWSRRGRRTSPFFGE